MSEPPTAAAVGPMAPLPLGHSPPPGGLRTRWMPKAVVAPSGAPKAAAVLVAASVAEVLGHPRRLHFRYLEAAGSSPSESPNARHRARSRFPGRSSRVLALSTGPEQRFGGLREVIVRDRVTSQAMAGAAHLKGGTGARAEDKRGRMCVQRGESLHGGFLNYEMCAGARRRDRHF